MGATLRILAVGSMYPPAHLGGYEVVWQDVMRRARAVGHTVRVLASDHRSHVGIPEEDPDVHRTLRWYWDWDRYEFTRLSARQRLTLERHNAAELDRHLADFEPDVVSWWAMGGMSLSLVERVRRRGVPGVAVIHDDWLVYGPRRDAWTRLWAGRGRHLARLAGPLSRVPTRVDVAAAVPLVFNSRYTRRRASEAGIDTTGAAVISPGVDERFLSAADPQPWSWRLSYVGRVDENKGVDVAVAALSDLPPEARLTIVGPGSASYLRRLTDQAAALGVAHRVTFVGPRERDALPAVYADADAVLFPVRWEEPWGLVPLEAMGIGRPVVATGRGGSGEFLRDGDNALIVRPDDPAAVATVIRRLATDESLRMRLRRGGLRTASRHTAEAFERRTVEAIEAAARNGA